MNKKFDTNKHLSTKKIIIGIDPGTLKTGYGIIALNNGTWEAVDYGCIKPPAKFKLSDRYLILFEGLDQLIEKYQPNVLAVETQFVRINPQSAIKLGMARGVSILAAKRKGMLIFEYTPMRAKRAVVGNGKASKQQVQRMIQHLLKLAVPPPEDASDALALALCHAHTSKFSDEQGI